MSKFSYKQFFKLRKKFLAEHCQDLFDYKIGNSNILISAPHGVNQVRLGKLKWAEIGTISTALILASKLDASYIIRSKNNNDDPNFDEQSAYKDKIKYLISVKGINYFIDIHGMAKSRDCDVNLGIRLGENIKPNIPLFNELEKSLTEAGFTVAVDNPFMAKVSTLAGYFAKEYGIWSIQIEINCKITNESANINKLNILLNTITKVLKNK